MNKTITKAVFYFLGVVTCAVLSFYAFWSAIYYAWMNANGSWTADKAAPWTFGSLTIAIVFFILFIYFIVKMVKLRKASRGQST